MLSRKKENIFYKLNQKHIHFSDEIKEVPDECLTKLDDKKPPTVAGKENTNSFNETRGRFTKSEYTYKRNWVSRPSSAKSEYPRRPPDSKTQSWLRPSSAKPEYPRKPPDAKRESWLRPSSAKPEYPRRPASAKSEQSRQECASPPRLAFLLSNGEISAEVRKHVRPSTAQPCSDRYRKAKDTVSNRSGKRLIHSAGPARRYSSGESCSDRETSDETVNTEKGIDTDRKHAWVSDRNYNEAKEIRSNKSVKISDSMRYEKTNSRLHHDAADDSAGQTGSIYDDEFTAKKAMKATGDERKTENVPSSRAYPDASNILQYLTPRRAKRKHEDWLADLKVDDLTTEEDTDQEARKERAAELFTRAARNVRLLVRLLGSMANYSIEMTLRSATEQQWHMLNTSKQVKELAFNKDIFAKRRAVSWLPRWARAILDKSPDNRTEKDLRNLHALLRGMKSFDTFTEKIQLAMCRSFTYQYVTSGRIILRQGHVGINFYFLYAGSVFVNIGDTDVHGNHFVKTEVILKKGDSFGELALLQDIKRTASISCRENCEMLVVDKDTFSRVCPKIFEKELEEKCDFLEKLNVFSPKLWPREMLKKICFDARIIEYKTNRIIVSDSTTDEWMYICMEGKCNIIRKLDLREQLKWIKKRREEINKRRGRRKKHSDDVIDLLGVDGAVTEETDEEEESERSSEASDLEAKRESLLTSMELEYSQTKRLSINDIKKYLEMLRPKKDKKKEKDDKKDEEEEEEEDTELREKQDGPLTLTALLAKEQRENIFFINLKTVEENEIFDLYSLLHCDNTERRGSYILVSHGSRMLRIKKQCFFKDATKKAIEHATTLADMEKYPEDEKLVRSYMEHLSWKIYKHSVLDHTLVKYKTPKAKKSIYNIAMTENSKVNAKHRDMLNALYQVFYEGDPKLRRIAKWKQMQAMAHSAAQRRGIEEIELITGIGTLGSLIPEIQIDLHEDRVRTRKSKIDTNRWETNMKSENKRHVSVSSMPDNHDINAAEIKT